MTHGTYSYQQKKMTQTTDVQEKIEEIMGAAYDGELTDTHRVFLLNVALTAAANELHRLASNGTPPSPEVLTLIQQVGLICDPDTTADDLAVRVTPDADQEEV